MFMKISYCIFVLLFMVSCSSSTKIVVHDDMFDNTLVYATSADFKKIDSLTSDLGDHLNLDMMSEVAPSIKHVFHSQIDTAGISNSLLVLIDIDQNCEICSVRILSKDLDKKLKSREISRFVKQIKEDIRLEGFFFYYPDDKKDYRIQYMIPIILK